MVSGYEVRRGGQGFSTRTPKKGDVITKIVRRGRGKKSKKSSPTITTKVQGSTVFIDGKGFTIKPENQLSFIQKRGGSINSSQRQAIQKNILKRQQETARKIAQEAEIQRINQKAAIREKAKSAALRKQLTSQHAQKIVKDFINRQTGEKERHETLINRRTGERIFTRTNLATGVSTTKVFKKVGGRIRQTGGLTEQRHTKKTIDELQKSLPFGDKVIFNKVTNEILGIQSNILKKSIPYTEKGLEFYQNSLNRIQGSFSKSSIDKTKEELNVLRKQLNKIKQTRFNKIQEVKDWRTGELKKINNLNISAHAKKSLKNKVENESNSKIKKIKLKLDPKGIELQGKVLGKLGKSIALSYVKSGKDVVKLAGKGAEEIFNFGGDIVNSPKTRRDIVKVVKSIPKYTYLTGKVIFNIGEVIGGNSEERKKFAQIASANWKNLSDITKDSRDEIAHLVRTSPAEAILIVGSEILIMKGTGKAFKIVNKVNKKALGGIVKIGGKTISKSAYLTRAIKKAGTPVRIVKKARSKTVKIIKIKKDKIFARSKFQKLTPKGIKLRAAKLKRKVAGSKRVTRITAERKKVATRRKREITRAKRFFPEDRIIKGVKVSKREFKSYKVAEKMFDSFKKLRKFITDVKAGVGKGSTERISKGILSPSEIKLLSGLRGVPKELLKNVKKIDVTIFTTPLRFKVPTIVRDVTLKKGKFIRWRFAHVEQKLFHNTVSYGLINAKGKVMGSVSFSTISKKSLVNFKTGGLSPRFRNVRNAIRFGTDKSIIFSRQHGKQYVRSLSKSLDRRIKPTLDEFISKFKSKTIKDPIKAINVINLGKVKATRLITKKVTKASRFKSVKKKFKRGQEVSRELLLEKKIPAITKSVKKNLKIGAKRDIEKLQVQIERLNDKILKMRKQVRSGIDIDAKKFKIIADPLLRKRWKLQGKLDTILRRKDIYKSKAGAKIKVTSKTLKYIRIPKEKIKLTSIKKLERATPDITLDKLERLLDSKIKIPKTQKIKLLEKQIKFIEKQKRIISQSFNINVLGADRNKVFRTSQKKIGALERRQANLRINIINEEIKLGIRKLQFMKPLKVNKVIKSSPKQKLKLLESVLKKKKTTTRRITTGQARAAASIPKRIKFNKRIEGIRELKKIKNMQKIARQKLLRKGLSKFKRASLLSIIKALDILSKNLTKSITKSEFGKIKANIQKNAKITKKITEKITIPPIIPPIIRPRGGIRPPPSPPPKKPIIAFKLPKTIKKTKKLKRPITGYSIQIKKRGKYVKMKAPLFKLQDAKDVLAYNVDQTLARSARIVPEGKTKVIAILKPGVKQTFKRNRKKFRGYKIKQGKKKQLVRSYIEKRKYFQDTPLERAQTRVLRKKLKKKTTIKRRIVVKRPVKRKLTTIQKRVLINRLKKARAVRMRDLKK